MQGRSQVLNYLLYNLHDIELLPIDEKLKWNYNAGCKCQLSDQSKGFSKVKEGILTFLNI